MIAFYKRELRGYFHGMFGWIFVALLILASGAITVTVSVIGGSSQFSYIVGTLSDALILLLPLLTVCTFTRENRLQNRLWLNSLPVPVSAQIAGKYLAMLTLFAIPTALLAIFPPLLALQGTVAYGSAYAAITGYFLMGAALLSTCGFVASLFENRVFAAILTVLFCLLLYLSSVLAALCEVFPWVGCLCCVLPFVIAGIWQAVRRKRMLAGILIAVIPAAVCGGLFAFLPKAFSRFLPDVMEFLSPFTRLDGFRAGHFDLPAAVYLISITVLFVFLTAALPVRFRKKGA